MEKRFDQLSIQALALADTELSNIAETETISEAERQHITEMALQKAGFSNASGSAVRRKPAVRRLGILLLSAALAVTIMGVSVSGYTRYNREQAEKNFGVLGTRRLEDMNLPDPVKYTNGTVDLSVEAVLCDGAYALVLATMTAAGEGLEIDWENSINAYESVMDDPDLPGQTIYCYENAIRYYSDYELVDDQCWITWVYEIQEDAEDTMTLQFYQGDAAGIAFDIPLVQNTPLLTLASENGVTLRLSGYQIYAHSMSALSASTFELHRNDGSQTICHLPSVSDRSGKDASGSYSIAYAKIYESIEGVEFDQNDPSTFIGYIDISDVAYITLDGTDYYVQD